jgi:hypothetical protein
VAVQHVVFGDFVEVVGEVPGGGILSAVDDAV